MNDPYYKNHASVWCSGVGASGVILLVAAVAWWAATTFTLPLMVIGILCGMTVLRGAVRDYVVPATSIMRGTVLRWGVALIGVRLNFSEAVAVGWQAAFLVLLTGLVSLVVGVRVARWLGLSSGCSIVSACGVSICGVSAAMAVSAALPRSEVHEKELAVIVVSITFLSTSAMLSYPLVLDLLGLNETIAGVVLGASLHDVAHVVAAGYGISDKAGAIAVVTKLLRIMLLLPIVTLIGFQARSRGAEGSVAGPPLVPPFLLFFIALLALNSIGALPPPFINALTLTSRFCLLLAMVSIGASVSLSGLLSEGWRPLAAMSLQTLFLACVVVCAVFVLLP